MNISTVCFTGHRPNKLDGYNPKSKGNNRMLLELRKIIVDHIENKDASIFITGMALGIDMWAARIILALKSTYPHLQLVAAIPCANHSSKWIQSSQDEWKIIIDQCDHVHYVSDDEYTNWCMQKRNEWMVDNSDFIIAIYNGVKGGTRNCITYADKKDKKITKLHPKTLVLNE